MMQQVASTKSDIAAFAGSPAQNQQSDNDSSFDQIFQQQSFEPLAQPNVRRGVQEKQSANNEKEAIRNNGRENEPQQGRKQQAEGKDSSIRSEQKPDATSNDNNPVDTVEQVATKKEMNETRREEQNTQGEELTQAESRDKKSLELVEKIDDVDNDSEQVNAEDWVQLVEQLNLLAQNENEMAKPLLGNITFLQNWLSDQDDKTTALVELMQNNPEIQDLLESLGDSANIDLKQIAELVIQNITQNEKPAAMSGEPNLIELAKDIEAILASNRLTNSDITQLHKELLVLKNGNTESTASAIDRIMAKLDEIKIASTELNRNTELNQISNELSDTEFTLDPTMAKNLLKEIRSLLHESPQEESSTTAIKAADSDKSSSPISLDEHVMAKLLTELNALAKSSDNQQKSGASILTSVMQNTQKADLPAVPKTQDDAKIVDVEEAVDSLLVKVTELMADKSKKTSTLPDVYKVASDLGQDLSKSDKAFLSTLKAGIEEFKDQLAAGREPGLDLKALVADAISKSGDNQVSAKVAQELEHSLRSLNQSMLNANQMTQSLDSHNQHLLRSAGLDTMLTQAAETKATQPSQFESRLDKAINLTKPEGHQQLADKMRWMVNTGNLVAEIRLDPAELGSMHVKVSMSADSATVNFVVQSHQTRDALETATPKLRELLADKGIDLGQTSVRQESQSKQDTKGQTAQQDANGVHSTSANDEIADDSLLVTQQQNLAQSAGGIDYFV